MDKNREEKLELINTFIKAIDADDIFDVVEKPLFKKVDTTGNVVPEESAWERYLRQQMDLEDKKESARNVEVKAEPMEQKPVEAPVEEPKVEAVAEPPKPEEPKKKKKSKGKAWLRDIIIAVIIVAALLFFFRPVQNINQAMTPNFGDGDILIASRQTYKLLGGFPSRGDVVAIKTGVDENGKNEVIVKRVIGLPGEHVEIKDGYVYINGSKLNEPYLAKEGETDAGLDGPSLYQVPAGKVFVMGDNRPLSIDSRNAAMGCIDVDDIVGQILVKVYPFKEIKVY
ncbi:MAG: signal peptidase I [Clostridia bacterium]|nr:signal peptidase I [Clostridia bacterium]